MIQSHLKTHRMAEALDAFAAYADPTGQKLLLVIVDNAAWHRTRRLRVPANVRLHFLPPRTPELQPAEPFWTLIRECVANETFATLAALRRRVQARCQWLTRNREEVPGVVGFRWARNLEK
jgi:transposase